MGREFVGRITALTCVALMLAALALFLDEKNDLESATAQAQPTAVPGTIVQLPPPVPGLDYTPPQPGQTTIPAAATTGTPVAADPGTAAAPASGESVTASLGGSDIAVSSVGGSYERDVPNKRRGDRKPRR
ncbi:MAG: hypothetical protein K0S78_5690 [Thermomicrobiales bacterium]|jgi:hypothetical protein|nr:hypothetical protein [Thermomicrobiales bacterium]